MRHSGSAPSIVPGGSEQNVYIVVEDFGRRGHAFRETDTEMADLETTLMGLLEGQYSSPLRVVAFNTTEKWSDDVSAEIARELHRRLAHR